MISTAYPGPSLNREAGFINLRGGSNVIRFVLQTFDLDYSALVGVGTHHGRASHLQHHLIGGNNEQEKDVKGSQLSNKYQITET